MNTTLQYDGGLQTVIPLQVVYLDFDGESTSYRGEILTIDNVMVEDSGLTAAEITILIKRLNEAYASNVLFVTELPQSGDYSTVFVGHTEAFGYRGLAETIDHGNQIKTDNAFVNLKGGESLEQIQQTIAHEVDHLIGIVDHGGEGLAAYAYNQRYDITSGVTSTGIGLYYDSMYISSGGTANSTTVHGGYMSIDGGGVANSTTVNNGRMSISSGGVADSTTVNSGGSMTISSGGTATITFNPWRGMVIASTGAAVTYLDRDYYAYFGGYDTGVISKANTFENLEINSGRTAILYLSGVANSTTVNAWGDMTISSGGVANNTTVNNYGSMCISSGGTANSTTVNSSGYMSISSGGVANSTTVNSSGYMCIDGGGVANSTTVNNGYMFIDGGGTATNIVATQGARLGITVASDTYIQGSYNGSAFEMKDAYIAGYTVNANGSMTIASGGVANSTTVNSGGGVDILEGGSMNNAILNSGGRMYVSGGAVEHIQIHSGGRWENYGGIAKNVVLESGGKLVQLKGQCLNIQQEAGGLLNARVYENNPEFKITGHNANGSFYLSNGVASNFIIYEDCTLDLMGGKASHTVLSGGKLLLMGSNSVADDTIINSEGRIIVESDGGMVNNTTVNSGGYMDLSIGGTANHTTIYAGGTQTLGYDYSEDKQKIAHFTTIHSGGLQKVYIGGFAADTVVSSGGHQKLYKRAIVSNTTVMSGGLLTVGDVSITLEGTITLGGNMTVREEVDAENAQIVFAVNQRQSTDAAIIDNLDLIQSGTYSITVDAAQATGTYKLAGGAIGFIQTITVKDTSGTQLGSLKVGGTFQTDRASYSLRVNNNTLNFVVSPPPSYDGVQIFSSGNVVSSAFNISGVILEAAQTDKMVIGSGGIAYDTLVNTFTVQHISSGGQAERTSVTRDRELDDDPYSQTGQYIYSGGIANSSFIDRNGFQWISGGTASYTTLKGIQRIYSGGIAKDTVLIGDSITHWGGDQRIYSGGTAYNTILSEGGQDIHFGGVALNTLQHSGANVSVYISGGDSFTKVTGTNVNGSFWQSNGVAENFIMYGGIQYVENGGVANKTTIFKSFELEGFTGSGVQVVDHGTVNDTQIVYGRQELMYYASANRTSIESGGVQLVGSGTYKGNHSEADLWSNGCVANQTRISSGGQQIVYTGSIASDTTVLSGGTQTLSKGAEVRDVLLERGGQMNFTDAGVILTGKITLEGSLTTQYTIQAQDAEFVFTLEQRQTADTVAINSLELLQGGTYAVTIAASQTEGTYRLAGNAAQFNQTIQVYGMGTEALGRLQVGGTLQSGSGIYRLLLDANHNLLFEVGYAPLMQPVITTNTTQPTNRDVVLSVTFDLTAMSNQYSFDGQKWLDYAGAVTVTRNSEVFFRSTRSSGATITGSYTVSNIDKVAPTITGITPNTTAPTNQNITLNAVFGDNVALASKQYKLGNGNWLNYTGAITVTDNTTVFFKAVDSAGNEATAQYVVANIDRIAPNAPQWSLNPVGPTNQNVSITATFAADAVRNEYSLDGKSWKGYTSAVTVTENQQVWFRSFDAAGNMSSNSCTVSNIDKVAPNAPTLSVSTTYRTNGSIKVTADFAADVTKKEYSLDGKNWQSYTGSVTVNANTLFQTRGYDAAGNVSSTQYDIKNIIALDPKGPGTVTLTPKVSKYNVSIKWNKPATQDKAKITGYEVEVNGKISIVKGTSLSLKNVPVSVGNTIQVRAIDSLGRYGALSTVTSFDVKDVTAPKLEKVTASITGYTGNLAWSGTDNVGIVKYVVTCAGQTRTITSGTSTKFENLAVGKYKATVQGFDAAGNVSKTGSVSITVKDATSPEKVIGLSIPLADAKYTALLSWAPGKDNSGKVSGYEIRLDNGKIFKSSKNSLKVSKLSVGTHSYQVRAIDPTKNVGEWSDIQTFTVKDVTIPATVSIKAKVEGNSLVLSWKTPKDNVGVTGYILRYGVNLEHTETLTASQLSRTISGIAKGTYQYSIVAVDAAGNPSKPKTGKATIKTELPMAMNLELPDATPNLAFDAGMPTDAPSAALRYDDPLAICAELRTAAELRLTASELFNADSDKKQSPLLAAGW